MKSPNALEPHLEEPGRTDAHGTGAAATRYPELEDDGKGGNKYWWVWVIIFALIAYGCYRLYDFENAKKAAVASRRGPGAVRPRALPVSAAAARAGDIPVYLQGSAMSLHSIQ